jgi:hypothetical protein
MKVDRPTLRLRLRPLARREQVIHRLRALLKALLRRHGFQALSIEEERVDVVREHVDATENFADQVKQKEKLQ